MEGGRFAKERQVKEIENFIYQNGLIFIIIISTICGGFKEVDNFVNCCREYQCSKPFWEEAKYSYSKNLKNKLTL